MADPVLPIDRADRDFGCRAGARQASRALGRVPRRRLDRIGGRKGGTIFEALEAHLSSGANQPPSSFWKQLGSRVSNTREVVVGEIALSVTNGKDWERNMTLVRRIPRSTS